MNNISLLLIFTLWLAAASVLSITSYSFIGIMVLLTIHSRVHMGRAVHRPSIGRVVNG